MLLSIGSSVGFASSDGEIKIGYLSALTGNESGEAKNLTNELNLAVKQVNDGGGVGGKKIQIVIEDNHSNPKQASEACAKLVNETNIVAMIPKGSPSLIPTILGRTASDFD